VKVMVSIVQIIEKYNPDEDNTFSNEDVVKMAKEIVENEKKSLFNNKIIIAACAVVAIVSAVDRSFVRMNNVNASGGSHLPPVRHMQEGVPSFSEWLECKAVATVPKSYVDTGAADGMAYVCEPKISCEEQVATASPTVTVITGYPTAGTASPTPIPTTPRPTESPTMTPILTPTKNPSDMLKTGSPTKGETTYVTIAPVAKGCYNTINFGYKGDLEHSCEWVQRTDFRREVLCTKQTDVREACPVSCGTCCDDNPDFTTNTPFGPQGCAWIGSNPLRKIGYCPVPDVGTYCAKTCDKCGPYMSMVPTMYGTSNETSAPTGRLDDD